MKYSIRPMQIKQTPKEDKKMLGNKQNVANKNNSCSLPTTDEAGVIAVSMSEHLTAQEQSFFIAGFRECIKYLMQLNGDK